MNLIKKIMFKIMKQRKLEQEFADENLMSYKPVNYIRAKVKYLSWVNGKKFRTIDDYKKEVYGDEKKKQQIKTYQRSR